MTNSTACYSDSNTQCDAYTHTRSAIDLGAPAVSALSPVCFQPAKPRKRIPRRRRETQLSGLSTSLANESEIALIVVTFASFGDDIGFYTRCLSMSSEGKSSSNSVALTRSKPRSRVSK